MERIGRIGNAEYMNRINKIKVIDMIRRYGEISRSEIVKQTGLSAPTVTRIVENLINVEQLAVQVGKGDSSGGRPPMIVRFNAESSYVIGIDWGRTHILGVISDLNGNILYKRDLLIESSGDFDTDLSKMFDLVENIIEESELDRSKINGVGVAVAGYVNKKNSVIEFSPNFGWRNADVKSQFLKRFDVPIIVENVSKIMAQGEFMYGDASNLKNFIFVNVGHGIGSGIVINGKLLYGHDGFSGEIGHTKAIGETDGRQCSCGKKDCLENYSSGRGLVELVKLNIEKFPSSSLNRYSEITAKEIINEAISGDSFASEIIDDAADKLGIAIASISNILNPEAIVLGGGVIMKNDYFIVKVRESFKRETLRNSSREIDIIKSSLEGETTAKGAIALILNEILNFRELK